MENSKEIIQALSNEQLYKLGKFDNANRWHPTDDLIRPYFNNIRTPSRAWPYSYWKAAKTKKFAKWYAEKVKEVSEVSK